MNLAGCLELDDGRRKRRAENVSRMSLVHLESLVHSNDVRKLMSVQLIGIESKDARSSGFLKDCVSFLPVMLRKLQDVVDGVTHCIGFWKRDTEELKQVFDGR